LTRIELVEKAAAAPVPPEPGCRSGLCSGLFGELIATLAAFTKGFVRKQFICHRDGGVAGGLYMWETHADAEAFYTGPWRDGIRARYGNDPKIQYFETVALADKASGRAGAI
jgi:hypothetical protein